MSLKFTILGCGSSMGVPRPDGFWGNCNPSEKKRSSEETQLKSQSSECFIYYTRPKIERKTKTINQKNI